MLCALLALLLVSPLAQAQVPCKELGGSQHSCFPMKETFYTTWGGQRYYSDSVAGAASKAASLARANIPGFGVCNFGLLTREVSVGPNDLTEIHGPGSWEGYTSLNPVPGQLMGGSVVLWGQTVNSDGKTVVHKCRAWPEAGLFKDMSCPASSAGTVVNHMPDGRALYMCASKEQSDGFVRQNVPDPATSRDVNPEGEITSCNPVSMCGSNRKIVREIDYTSQSRFPIVWGRTYNHRSGLWRFDYDRQVLNYFSSGTSGSVVLRRHDGGELKFKATAFANGRPTQWAPDMDGKLTVLSKFSALYHANGTLLGFSLANFQGEIELYDPQGRLTRLENWHGDGVDLIYDSEGRLSRLNDDQGRFLKVSYANFRVSETQVWKNEDGSGDDAPVSYTYFPSRGDLLRQTLPSSVTDGTTTIAYGYTAYDDSADRAYFLQTVTNGNGHTRTYVYGENANPWELTGIVDEGGNRYATYTYSNGDARTVSHGTVGDLLLFEGGSSLINAKGHYTQIYSSNSLQSSTDYQVGKYAGMSGPSPFLNGLQASEIAYDTYGNPTTIRSFTGSLELRTYDGPRGLPLSITQAAGTAAARTRTFTWLPNAPFLASVTETVKVGATSRTRTTTLAYDAHYRVEEVRVAVNDGSPDRVRSFGYDAAGNLVLSVDEAGLETTYTHDGQGNVLSRSLGSNTAAPQVTTFGGYNAQGLAGWAQDPNGLRTAFAYDGQQRVVGVTQTVPGAGAVRAWAFGYAPTGLLSTVTTPDGSTQTLLYDSAHRLVETQDRGPNGALLGRTVYALNTSSEVVGSERFDGQGQRVLASTAGFDAYGRANALRGALGQTTQDSYDLDGRLTQRTNPLLGTTTYTYDALHRATKVKDAMNGKSLLTYGPQDELLTATDARGVATSYAYNGFGDLVRLGSPDRGTWTFTHDGAGRTITATDPRGVVVTTGYDAFSRPITRTFSDAGVSASTAGFEPGSQVHTFAYDSCAHGVGRLCQVVDGSGLTAYAHNAWGEVVGKAWTGKAGGPAAGITLSSGYGYDASTGRLTSIAFPSGKTQVLTYGPDGRLSALSYAGQGVASQIHWTAFGAIAGWHWPQATGWSGVHSSVVFTYDQDGRPERIADLDQRDLVWDHGDRLVGVDDPADASRSQLYGYDSLDRLTSADIGAWNGPVAFTYDAAGNRTSVSEGNATSSWQYAYGLTSNRLASQSSVTNGTTTATFASAYDSMGNLVSDGIGLQLSYDATGRLARGAKGPQEMTARYNALGQRMLKASGSQTRVYAVDEMGRPLGVYVVDANASNGFRVEEEYVHLDGWRPVAVIRPDPATGMANPQVFPILTDHLGTPRKVLDGATGQTRWSWDAKQPFGHEMPLETPAAGLPAFTLDLRFPGQRFDEETGLFHNGFRDYHPGLGRYVQSDPLGLEAGWNTYGYVGGNPGSNIDPMGLSEQDIKRIRKITDAYVVGAVARGERSALFGFRSGRINSSYNNLAGYKVCTEQAPALLTILGSSVEKGEFDDNWKFRLISSYTHTWVEGRSDNPNDPILKVDPWVNDVGPYRTPIEVGIGGQFSILLELIYMNRKPWGKGFED